MMRSFVTFTPRKIREYNKVTEYKVGWTCSMLGTNKLHKKILIRKSEIKRGRGEPTPRCEDSITINIKGM
jgi:hypothetical protein